MDFMKVLDQTVREIKREVNLKVLKVPEIEQKVLDATSDEPWGPHGSALAELALATKKFTECQMIMNVLWTRLSDTGAKWRHVYKALTIIEYLIGNGSERAVDDILEHSFRISSLSDFEYVEPNGKDAGINVRKKVETLVALLADKEKIQTVRNKAAATRDKYFGLSSTGITYKSSTSSYGSTDRFGGFGNSREDDSFKYSYKDEHKDNLKSRDGHSVENENSKPKRGTSRHAGRNSDSSSSTASKTVTKPDSVLFSKSPSVQPDNCEDDFDDFDPRGSGGSANTSAKQIDLFGENLVDLMDAPATTPNEPAFFSNTAMPEVDLFADATFVSASPHTGATTGPYNQCNIDLFASQPAVPAPSSATVDSFGATDSGLLSETKYSTSEPKHTAAFDPFVTAETKSLTSEPTNTKTFDPFGAIPLNNFEESDSFGDFTSHAESATTVPQQNITNNMEQTSLSSSKPAPKRETFQVKSGIWADSLNRGLIDLNISAPKKVNLADIGIVGGLGDVSGEKEKGLAPAWYMGGSTTGAGSGMGKSGLSSSAATWGSGSFSNLG